MEIAPTLQHDNYRMATNYQTKIIALIMDYLRKADIRSCKLVCKSWYEVLRKCNDSFMSSTYQVLRNPLLVDEIYDYLWGPDTMRARSINFTFEYVSRRKVFFHPTLTDITYPAFLRMANDVRVSTITVRNFFKPIPAVEENGALVVDCDVPRSCVMALTYNQAVSKFNKQVLINTYKDISTLKFNLTTDFVLPANGRLEKLKKLEIQFDSFDESRTLLEFFERAEFPMLAHLSLHIKLRFDYSLYQELHHFIIKHFSTLERLFLVFSKEYSPLEEQIPLMFLNFSPEDKAVWEKIYQFFLNNTKRIECRFRKAKCEGQGKFTLTTALQDNQHNLNPTARLNYDPDPPPPMVDVSDDEEDFFPFHGFFRLGVAYHAMDAAYDALEQEELQQEGYDEIYDDEDGDEEDEEQEEEEDEEGDMEDDDEEEEEEEDEEDEMPEEESEEYYARGYRLWEAAEAEDELENVENMEAEAEGTDHEADGENGEAEENPEEDDYRSRDEEGATDDEEQEENGESLEEHGGRTNAFEEEPEESFQDRRQGSPKICHIMGRTESGEDDYLNTDEDEQLMSDRSEEVYGTDYEESNNECEEPEETDDGEGAEENGEDESGWEEQDGGDSDVENDEEDHEEEEELDEEDDDEFWRKSESETEEERFNSDNASEMQGGQEEDEEEEDENGEEEEENEEAEEEEEEETEEESMASSQDEEIGGTEASEEDMSEAEGSDTENEECVSYRRNYKFGYHKPALRRTSTRIGY